MSAAGDGLAHGAVVPEGVGYQAGEHEIVHLALVAGAKFDHFVDVNTMVREG